MSNTKKSKPAKKTQPPVVKPCQKYLYYFIITAIIGYIYEYLLLALVYNEQFVNQGPLHGPWLIIYGIGGVIVIALLGRFLTKKVRLGKLNITPVLIALGILVIVTVVEYTGHYIMDTFFDFRPWDYSDKFLNINGRVCLEDSLRFVALGMVGMYGVVPIMEKVFRKITRRQNTVLFIILVSVLAVDVIYSFLI
jgi:uncharacterized membrane protein